MTSQPTIDQHAQDVALDAEIVGDDAMTARERREGRAVEVVAAAVEAILSRALTPWPDPCP
jgi:hypothetical protein